MIRGTDPTLYGPTGQATRSFRAGVMLPPDQWAQWQAEARQENAAAQAPLMAAAIENIRTLQAAAPPPPQISRPPQLPQLQPAPDPPTHLLPTGPEVLDQLATIPAWVKWSAGAAAALWLFTRK